MAWEGLRCILDQIKWNCLGAVIYGRCQCDSEGEVLWVQQTWGKTTFISTGHNLMGKLLKFPTYYSSCLSIENVHIISEFLCKHV